MPFTITYEPLNRIAGFKPSTYTAESAAETLRTVDSLLASDERVTISGDAWSVEELKVLAEREADIAR